MSNKVESYKAVKKRFRVESYKTVCAASSSELDTKVNALLTEGWRLYRTPRTIQLSSGMGQFHYQALVLGRYEAY